MQNQDRNFAIEFLMDSAACFPADKTNQIAIARSLEAAVYEWSKVHINRLGGKSEVDAYWERIHDVVAAIVGKRKMGSIVNKILNGEYPTAMDLVKLPRKHLFLSFEGFGLN